MNTMTLVARTLRQNPVLRLYKYYIIDSILIVKQSGFRTLLRQRGWKFLLVIIGYYLVRDSVVYVLLPYAVARGLF